MKNNYKPLKQIIDDIVDTYEFPITLERSDVVDMMHQFAKEISIVFKEMIKDLKMNGDDSRNNEERK